MKLLTIFLVLVLSGCATGYQEAGFGGGFEDTQLSPTVFQVSVAGNRYTSATRTNDLALLRAAVLTIKNGFTNFYITSNNQGSNTSYAAMLSNTFTTATAYGGTANAFSTQSGGGLMAIRNPTSSLTIKLTNNQDENAFNAAFVKKSIMDKYGFE